MMSHSGRIHSGRNPLIILTHGTKGVGKTFQTKKVLIMDTDDEYKDGYNAGDASNNYGDGGLLVPKEASVIKSVYCNYRGYLIVYDVHGKKVHELSGEITLEKYEEIEKRSDKDITEFDGLEDYRCFACELKKKAQDAEWDNKYDPFANPIKGQGQFGTANSGTTSNSYKAPMPTPRKQPPITPPSQAIPHCASPPLNASVYFDTVKQQIGVYDGNQWVYYANTNTASSYGPSTQRQSPAAKPPVPKNPFSITPEEIMKVLSKLKQEPEDGDVYSDPLDDVLENMKKRNPF
jgi:hypothetical protein